VGDLNEARILIVDDEIANVRLLERLLTQAGYHNIATTTDARQVRTLYEELHPDLILLDLMMPHLDGFTFINTFAENEPERLRKIIVTSAASPAVIRSRLREGAFRQLSKPFDIDDLIAAVRACIVAQATPDNSSS